MTDAAASQVDAAEGGLSCYRHPDRETWIRCGRCDRPICTRCAMQGPVGMRCRDCGKPAFDALTSLRPSQILLGSAIAAGGAALVGYVAVQIGFFGILIGYFGGRMIVDVIERAIGFKRGRVMSAMVGGGVALGSLVGLVLGLAPMLDLGAGFFAIEELVGLVGGQLLLTLGALLYGAYARLR